MTAAEIYAAIHKRAEPHAEHVCSRAVVDVDVVGQAGQSRPHRRAAVRNPQRQAARAHAHRGGKQFKRCSFLIAAKSACLLSSVQAL